MQSAFIAKEEIAKARRHLMDILEAAFGEHPKWKYVRGRVLGIMGKDGLEAVFAPEENSTAQTSVAQTVSVKR